MEFAQNEKNQFWAYYTQDQSDEKLYKVINFSAGDHGDVDDDDDDYARTSRMRKTFINNKNASNMFFTNKYPKKELNDRHDRLLGA